MDATRSGLTVQGSHGDGGIRDGSWLSRAFTSRLTARAVSPDSPLDASPRGAQLRVGAVAFGADTYDERLGGTPRWCSGPAMPALCGAPTWRSSASGSSGPMRPLSGWPCVAALVLPGEAPRCRGGDRARGPRGDRRDGGDRGGGGARWGARN